MYDYVDGKVDWMAHDLPVEGTDGPFIGSRLAQVTTCTVDATVGDARRLLEEAGTDAVVVVAGGDRVGGGLVVGEVDRGTLEGHAGDEQLLDAMDPVPSTYRPSVTVATLADSGDGRWLVSTPDGRLLGQVTVDAAPDHDHGGHHHDHHHDGGEGEDDAFDRELERVMAAIGERFGEREPSESELRAFLHDRMVADGRTVEEADRFLEQLDADD